MRLNSPSVFPNLGSSRLPRRNFIEGRKNATIVKNHQPGFLVDRQRGKVIEDGLRELPDFGISHSWGWRPWLTSLLPAPRGSPN